jgi:hypothetical protein
MWWERLSDEVLLDVPLSRLGLRLEASPLQPRLLRLYSELDRAGLRFRPHVWLSTSWFSPDGVPGFAVPFFLAHPRLTRLEQRAMGEAEGGTAAWCLKLMRHETGHALDTAYRLHRRAGWRERFGPAGTPYRSSYAPRPPSRRFVQNLDHGYAQSHPLEDFAETFAVWLGSRGWRRAHRGWPALAKLEYVDALMREIAGHPARVGSRERPGALRELRLTLRQYYRRKQARQARLRRTRHRELLR